MVAQQNLAPAKFINKWLMVHMFNGLRSIITLNLFQTYSPNSDQNCMLYSHTKHLVSLYLNLLFAWFIFCLCSSHLRFFWSVCLISCEHAGLLHPLFKMDVCPVCISVAFLSGNRSTYYTMATVLHSIEFC